jgi:peroxiredoxin
LQAALAAPAPSAPPTGQAAAPIAVFRAGDLVQSLAARMMDGTTVALSGAGRPRAVVLFASWCEDYLAETVPESSRACAAVRQQVAQLASSDVEWLGVVHGLWTSPDSVGEYQKQTGTKLRLAIDTDGSLFRAFDVHQLPTVVLIDREGRVTRVVGPKDHDLADAVHALVAAR